MKTIKFQPTPNTQNLEDLLSHAINESIAMDDIQPRDIFYKEETLDEDESTSNMVTIKIPDIYPTDTVEHIEKNSENFSRVVTDFISFLTQKTEDLSEVLPLLLISEDEQETLLINLSDCHLHIYYHNNGQY